MTLSRLEFWRKTTHLLFGLLAAFVTWAGIVNPLTVLLLVPLCLAFVVLAKSGYAPLLSPLCASMEREENSHLPGKTAMYFIVSWAVLLWWFPLEIVLASILILSFGDSIGHLVGAAFGRIPTLVNPRKNWEGIVAGFLTAAMAAYLLVPREAAIFGAAVAMGVEALPHRIHGWELPDNFTVPLAAALAMSAVVWLLGAP